MEVKILGDNKISIGKAVIDETLVKTLENIQENDNTLINEYKESISDIIEYLVLSAEDKGYHEFVRQLLYMRELLTCLKSK